MTGQRWANVERLVVRYLRDTLRIPVYTETFADQGGTEWVTVARIGGHGYDLEKTINVEVDVHAQTRANMWALAARVEEAMDRLVAAGTVDGYVDDVAEVFAFAFDPPANRDVRRATATYALTLRPQGKQ